MQAIQYFVPRQLHHEVIGNHEKAVRQIFGILTKKAWMHQDPEDIWPEIE
jgi:hypothetical protein